MLIQEGRIQGRKRGSEVETVVDTDGRVMKMMIIKVMGTLMANNRDWLLILNNKSSLTLDSCLLFSNHYSQDITNSNKRLVYYTTFAFTTK